MEPVSFAMGAVALASLFSVCVECFDLIEVSRNVGVDYEILIVKLSIEKRRLMIWGEAVGVLRPDQDRDQFLDEPETHALIERILVNIQKMFHDAEAMRGKYGLEKAKALERGGGEGRLVEGSVVCAPLFAGSPVAQFQRRVAGFQQRAGLISRTKWAIRDNGKFASLIANLKDLLDGLNSITPSARTSILKSDLVRQETESIPDLRTLKIIEETCSDSDWKSSASAVSAGLNSVVNVSSTKRAYIHDWMERDQRPGASLGSLSATEMSRSRSQESPGESYIGGAAFNIPKARTLQLACKTSVISTMKTYSQT